MGRHFHYDKETGMSMAKFSKQGITAYGNAQLHPDDQKYASEFTGLTLAEMRAYKSFLKKRASRKKDMFKNFQGMADDFKKQYEEDLEREKEMELLIASFISEKEELHKKLSNPIKKTEWKELPDDFFNGVVNEKS